MSASLPGSTAFVARIGCVSFAILHVVSYDLLVCDEIGYVEVEPVQVGLFFTLLHRRKSTLITSNLGLAPNSNPPKQVKEDPYWRAEVRSVCAKSSPLNKIGSPVTLAKA